MTLIQITNNIVGIVNTGLIPVLYALAFLYFLAGVARYLIIGQGNEEAQEKGKKMMLFGLLGLALLFVVWGFVNLLIGIVTSTTGVSTT